MPSNDYLGLATPQDTGSHFNAITFLIRALLGQTWTATLVQVKAVTAGGGALALAGRVDVQPLVNQLDGQGQATPHAMIFNVPYFRAQGGANAVILDPAVGDVGIAIFADHDISSVIANAGQANPGSRRRYSPSDALYLGGFLNGVPTTFVQFQDGNMILTAPTGKAITLKAGTINIDADLINMADHTGSGATVLAINGGGMSSADIVVAGISVDSHVHSGVTAGASDTGPPV